VPCKASTWLGVGEGGISSLTLWGNTTPPSPTTLSPQGKQIFTAHETTNAVRAVGLEASERKAERPGMPRATGGLRDQGSLTLPPVRNSGPRGPRQIPLSAASAPQLTLEGSAGEFAPLELGVVESPSESRLWMELIERYH
jgi:hypothetical protein